MADSIWIDAGPRLLAALTCEDVAVSIALNDPAVDGRLTLQRVYNRVAAPVYPAVWTRLTLYSLWSGGELDHPYKIEARLRTPEGEMLATSQHTYKGRAEPETFASVMYLGVTSGAPLVLPAPGRYTIELAVDDVVIGDVALFAIKTEVSSPSQPQPLSEPAPQLAATEEAKL